MPTPIRQPSRRPRLQRRINYTIKTAGTRPRIVGKTHHPDLVDPDSDTVTYATAEIVRGTETGIASTLLKEADDDKAALLSKFATRAVIDEDEKMAERNKEKEKEVPVTRKEKTTKYGSETKSADVEHIPDGNKSSPHPIVDGRTDPRESAKDSVVAPCMRTESC